MSLLIDQTWVGSWKDGVPTQEQAARLLRWLSTVPADFRELVCAFPPLSLVRGRVPLEVPYPWTVGLVSSYHSQGVLGVRQDPSSDEVLVPSEKLCLVGFWKALNPVRVASILARSPY